MSLDTELGLCPKLTAICRYLDGPSTFQVVQAEIGTLADLVNTHSHGYCGRDTGQMTVCK